MAGVGGYGPTLLALMMEEGVNESEEMGWPLEAGKGKKWILP